MDANIHEGWQQLGKQLHSAAKKREARWPGKSALGEEKDTSEGFVGEENDVIIFFKKFKFILLIIE